MKYLLFGIPLLFVMICCYSCSNDAVIESDIPSAEQCIDQAQEEEIQELIAFVEMLNANLTAKQTQTRGRFWDRIKRILIGDAYGYGWGVQNGLPAKGGLITAAIFSIITAFDKDSSMPRIWTYVDGLASLDDKVSVRSYTQQINDEIDNTTLTGVVKSRLKTMVAIAECSKTLWIEIN